MFYEIPDNVLAKYPWCAFALTKIRELNVSLSDLVKKYPKVLEAAYYKIISLIEDPSSISSEIDWNLNSIEKLLVFPTVRMILSLINDKQLTYRWAVSESKITEKLLLNEAVEVIEVLAEKTFNWKLERTNHEDVKQLIKQYDWKLYFTDYIKYAVRLHDVNWKLSNKLLQNGFVYLSHGEFVRLIAEAVKVKILTYEPPKISLENLHKKIVSTINDVKSLWKEKKEELKIAEDALKGPIRKEAFPPCIKKLISAALSGENISHQGRFALTSFLLNIGMNVDQVVDLFKLSPDFKEDLTRYQVEHISGLRGTRIKYSPPSCETLKTYDLCPEGHELCKYVKHPISFYKKLIRRKFPPSKS